MLGYISLRQNYRQNLMKRQKFFSELLSEKTTRMEEELIKYKDLVLGGWKKLLLQSGERDAL